MTVFVSPAEPPEVKIHFTASNVPEQYGMDFVVPSKMGMIGIQRKTVSDFLSSVRDGRLTEQLIRSADLKQKYMVIEGHVFETRDGYMLTDWSADLTVEQFHKMMLTVGLEGYKIWRTDDTKETVKFVNTVESWGQKDRHSTVGTRGGPERDPWGRSSEDRQAIHFLQGLPGIGYQTAKNIYEWWGIPFVWSISGNELIKVPNVGKHRAKKLMEFISGDLY